MKKLTVLAYRDDADAIVRNLMNLRCVEIRRGDPAGTFGALERVEDTGERVRSEVRLNAIREVIPVLAKYTTRKKGFGRIVHRVDPEAFVTDGRADGAWQTVESTQAVCRERDALFAEQAAGKQLLQALFPWLAYDAPLNDPRSARTETVFGSCPVGDGFGRMLADLESVGAYPEPISEDVGNRYLAVTYLDEDADAVAKILAGGAFVKSSLPDVPVSAQKSYDQTEARLLQIEERLDNTVEELRTLAENLGDVEILCDLTETDLTVAQQKQKLLRTANCVLLEGWIPIVTTDAVTETLSKFECACEIADPAPDEEPPVLLHNNKFAQNFEWVVGMYSYPKYGTFDPTFIMSVFYFIIFGLMFADVGYGLLLILACFGGVKLLNPKPGMRRMLYMFGICGISCTLMGVLFGGWFGDLPTAIMTNMLGMSADSSAGRFFSNGLLFNPINNPMAFLIVSLGTGAVHLIAGMVIKFVLLCKEGRAGEAICTIATYWILFAGLGLLVYDQTIGLIVTLTGAGSILLLYGYGQTNIVSRLIKGFGGLYGLISYGSDLLSYSRVLALGMVAGVVGQVINMITALGTTGPIGFLFMLIVLVLGHVLNMGINILGTFVHAARLQYIEFFGKFYEDGGEPFDPAVPADNYTEPETPAKVSK